MGYSRTDSLTLSRVSHPAGGLGFCQRRFDLFAVTQTPSQSLVREKERKGDGGVCLLADVTPPLFFRALMLGIRVDFPIGQRSPSPGVLGLSQPESARLPEHSFRLLRFGVSASALSYMLSPKNCL